uniref:Uncharacterized protein n=1 Tax=Chromera velia CCMP2878 TaxID=1169474 RepID=A0A0K6SA25_9ALVE|eukprot:Cvel_9487.t1-p1 / transcript=Cvel_9487.t1 / gene=Cvel_9487 / organism=Chromera_velia_CCMP2878 / gene_product=hypothetical protein / transcript_product=hypothetical protein / location=Cvel_scaffold548:16156-18188(+) / protein_length=549 / sequence_SO=supercontig / SO=protein_coding / is_pseudo=false
MAERQKWYTDLPPLPPRRLPPAPQQQQQYPQQGPGPDFAPLPYQQHNALFGGGGPTQSPFHQSTTDYGAMPPRSRVGWADDSTAPGTPFSRSPTAMPLVKGKSKEFTRGVDEEWDGYGEDETVEEEEEEEEREERRRARDRHRPARVSEEEDGFAACLPLWAWILLSFFTALILVGVICILCWYFFWEPEPATKDEAVQGVLVTSELKIVYSSRYNGRRVRLQRRLQDSRIPLFIQKGLTQVLGDSGTRPLVVGVTRKNEGRRRRARRQLESETAEQGTHSTSGNGEGTLKRARGDFERRSEASVLTRTEAGKGGEGDAFPDSRSDGSSNTSRQSESQTEQSESHQDDHSSLSSQSSSSSSSPPPLPPPPTSSSSSSSSSDDSRKSSDDSVGKKKAKTQNEWEGWVWYPGAGWEDEADAFEPVHSSDHLPLSVSSFRLLQTSSYVPQWNLAQETYEISVGSVRDEDGQRALRLLEEAASQQKGTDGGATFWDLVAAIETSMGDYDVTMWGFEISNINGGSTNGQDSTVTSEMLNRASLEESRKKWQGIM